MTAPDAQAFSSTLILCINRNAYFSFLRTNKRHHHHRSADAQDF
jgi:hypothetical protein